MKRVFALIIMTLAACGPVYPKGNGTGPTLGSGAGSGSGSAVVTQPSAPGVFALAELKFYLGDDLGLQLHADGQIEENRADPGKPPQWAPLGKITNDGRLVMPDGNQVGAWQSDGTFKSQKGETAPFKFDGEALVVDGKSLTIDPQGILRGGSETEKVLRVEGATDAGSRRAALFVLALAFSGSDDGSAPSAPRPAP